MKRILGLLVIALTLCTAPTFAAPKAKFRLNVGTVLTETDPLYRGCLQFKKNVEARTKGAVAIGVFPNSLLGDTKEMQNQLKAGTNIAVISDPARLAESVPAIGILGAPYIVDGPEEAKKVTTSDWFKGLLDELAAKQGYRVLSFNWYQGARHFWTNKPVGAPSDLKGLRLRTPDAPVWQATVKAVGAVPVSFGWADVYAGIRQKAIDGCEAQHSASVGIKIWEVCKYLTKTSHFQLVSPLICSEQWFKSLPEGYQKILQEEASKAGDYAAKLIVDGLAASEEEFKKNGVAISTPDLAPFVKACDSVYDQLPNYREYQKQVKRILAGK